MNCEKIVDDGETEIRYVYHISDIHIRKKERREEFSQLFEKLYEYIETDSKGKEDISIIVITGDLVDSKTDMPFDSIPFIANFLVRISEILHVILIAGNHDCNLSNLDKMDPISVAFNMGNVLKSGSLKNITYLKKTGFYQYYNILFGFTFTGDKSILNNGIVPDDMLNKICQEKKYKIALFHGIIRESKTSTGYELKSERIRAKDFKNYNFGFFGDIHLHQFIDKGKTMAYSGSLIQQNFGEPIEDHGVLKWDLSKKKAKMVEIPNDWGFCTVNVKNGKIDIDGRFVNGVEIPVYPSIKLILEDTTEDQHRKISDKLKNRFNAKIVTEHKKVNDIKRVVIKSNKKNYSEYTDKYIKCNKLPPGVEKDHVVNLHKQICSTLDKNTDDTKKGKEWRLIELRFDNMFSYGEGNVVKFSEMDKGVIGIVAPNHHGKSAIMDVLLFCLFQKTSRGDAENILKNGTETFKCYLHFEIDNVKYTINRSYSKVEKKNAKNKVEFAKYELVNGKIKREVISNSIAKNKTGANHEIVKYVGSYEDMLTSYICVQSHNKQHNLTGKGAKEKKMYLYDILGLNIFEVASVKSKNELKRLATLIKEKKKQISKIPIKQLKNKYLNLAKLTRIYKNEKIKYNDIINLLKNNTIFDQQPILVKYDSLSMYNLETEEDIQKCIDEVQKEIINSKNRTTHADIKTYQAELNKLQSKDFDNEIELYSNKINSLHSKKININKPSEDIETLQIKMNDFNNNLSKVTKQLDDLKKQLDNINRDKNQTIDIREKDMLNVELRIRKEHLGHLDTILNLVDSGVAIKCINKYADTTNKRITDIKKIINSESIDKDFVQNQIEKLSSKKKMLKLQIDNYQTKINDAQNYHDNKKMNNLITTKINNLQEKLNSIKNKKKETLIKIDTVNNEIQKLKKIVNNDSKLEFTLKKLTEYMFVFQNYEASKRTYDAYIKDIDKSKSEIVNLDLKIQAAESSLKEYKSEIKNYRKIKTEYNNLCQKERLYSYYNKMVDANGIPYDILKTVFPLFTDEINCVLKHIADFTIKIKYDMGPEEENESDEKTQVAKKSGRKKTKVTTKKSGSKKSQVAPEKNKTNKDMISFTFFICRGENEKYPLSLASGYESFITGLAIRMALGELSTASKPNFFFVDEGWSSLDKANIENVGNIFNYLTTKFNHVIIISHLDEIGNSMQKTIGIGRDEATNTSMVRYPS